MKTKLWMLGMAVAALTSCTQSEVVDVPQNKVIGFDTYVENGTRTASDVGAGTINEFHVFGYTRVIPESGTATGDFTNLFNNTEVTKSDTKWIYTDIKYWQTHTQYRFAAYANGLTRAHLSIDGTDNKVSYDPSDGNDKIVFTNYLAGSHDLVAAISGDISTDATITAPDVPFSFAHMLTKIGFSFYANTKTTIKISDVAIQNASNKGTCTYAYKLDRTQMEPEWSTLNDAQEMAYVSSITEEKQLSTTSTRYVFYIIPQNNANVNVRFKLTTYDEKGKKIDNEYYTASLKTELANHAGVWNVGYVYEYYTTFDEGYEEVPIDFTVKDVDGWSPATDTQGVQLKPTIDRD